MELLILFLFCTALLVCVGLHLPILYALTAGLLLFCVYALKRGFSAGEILLMCWSGIKTARNVLITFLLIGILTALWRTAGTIPVIICYSGVLITPALFLVMSFLLNCAVSLVTGTAFGTAATMGVICASMASAMEIPPALVGGAVLSGVYFGDRCSPVSTSALLVSELTHTNIFANIHRMIKTAAVPFFVTCGLYAGIGFFTHHGSVDLDLTALFGQEFQLHWIALLPALLILVLSLCRLNVKRTMLASILCAIPVCMILQKTTLTQLAAIAVFGFQADNAEVAELLNGGGVISMLNVATIVCLSSAYSGIFRKTGLLQRLQRVIVRLSERMTPMGAMLITSAFAAMIACNQTLTIMLTHQLCLETEPDDGSMAIDLENTAVVVAPMIPWSIASGVPLASVGAPAVSIVFAFFLFLLPIWRLILALIVRKRGEHVESSGLI